MRIPRQPAPGSLGLEAVEKGTMDTNAENLSILIIEDDLVDRKSLERLLSRSSLSSAKVRCAGCLKDALEAVAREHFDIILSDLGLPDSNGIEAVNQLQATVPQVPLLVLSGLDDETTAIAAVQQGAQDYLIKGRVDSQLLVRSIRYAIERKRAERNMQAAEQRYRTVFENSAVAIMLVDEQERLISWNRFTENLLGMSHDDLHLRPIRSFYPEDEWEKIRSHNIRQRGMQHHIETRMLIKGGGIIDVDVSLSVLKDVEDRVVGSIGVIRDITERKRAEEGLERSYSLLHATLESTADGLLVVDGTGQVASFNQKFVEMWGIPRESLEKGNGAQVIEAILDLVTGAEDFLSVVRGLSDNPQRVQSGVLECRDGRVVEHYSQPQYLAGKVHGRVWSFRDITDRRKAVEALGKSEERFRQVVENSEEWIWEVDGEGLYTYVSPVVQRLIGYAPDEMVGRMHLYDLFHPEDRDRLKNKVSEIFTRKETFRELECRNQHKDGHEVWLSKSGVPMLDEHQNVIGYRGVAVDVTERRRIHEILHRKQKNLEAIFDAAPVGMLLVDEQMRVRRANDSIRTLSGKDYPQIINQLPGHVLGCIHAADNPANCESRCGDRDACAECAIYGTIRRSVESGLPVHGVEIQASLRVNGQEVNPSLSISVEPVVIDAVRYTVVAVNDVTDRAKAERELRETMEIKSQFISTVSHELRTPLASMKEAVLIVLDGVAGPLNDDQRHFLDVAERNIDRLWRLINEVLDFQKLGAGKMKFRMQENDLAKVAEDSYTTMLPYASKRRIHLSLSVEPNLPKGLFDGDRIIQVVTNLLSNAVKFTPEEGKVTLDVGRRGEEFVLRISDTGLGIPKEAMGKIFDRFYRVHRPGKEIKGTGLGLSIVKVIVTAHGGRIDVASEVDQGTTFTVHLPMAPKTTGDGLSEAGDTVIETAVASG